MKSAPLPLQGRGRNWKSTELMSIETLKPVTPVRPAAAYLGGKRNLAKVLVPMIDAIDHETYAEPFVGMGGVFLRRRHQPKQEVINDVNGELITFYRVLQNHYAFFMEMMRFQIASRAEFDRLVRTDPSTLTDLQRAARFFYLQRNAFGGKVTGQNFGVSLGRSSAFDVTRLAPLLDELHSRLAGVIIECEPYAAHIARYDRPGTLFYLDPPYYGGENDYGRNIFERQDYARLADVLASIKGRFILSINDTPEIRETFSRFKREEVSTSYTIGPKAKAVRELIFTGGI